MQLHVKGKNLEVNESIRSYAERKLRKLDRQLNDSARVEVELAVEKNPSIAESQVAEATVHVKGRTLRARNASRDMRAAIDELADKLIRQVQDVRGKRVSKRKHADAPPLEEPAEARITES
jgi:putative sigma-54 modulation protein